MRKFGRESTNLCVKLIFVNSLRIPFFGFVLLFALPFVQALGLMHRVLHDPHNQQNRALFSEQFHENTHTDALIHDHEPHSVASSNQLFQHEPHAEFECQLYDEATGACGLPSWPKAAVVAPCCTQFKRLNLPIVASSLYWFNLARGPPLVA